jgi:hypothetical protein
VQTRATGGVEVWTALGMQEERAVTLAANSFFLFFREERQQVDVRPL